ncbi:hypothetical protein PL8927_630104 [Planktothrix serta PCC 8927]|uniref:Uncharacterized protein n=1 Tax=Planktothrix serta PCC 8927 TaxID=671068 RepID=A0A7Z9BPN8_9CYAN|nr:hypothetical protein PL8927_630104 [Planktothrix serta PCC 8927]
MTVNTVSANSQQSVETRHGTSGHSKYPYLNVQYDSCRSHPKSTKILWLCPSP